jgi:hypothetical protein
MDEHLASELFSNVEEPNPPWAFQRLSMPFIYEREDDEETEKTLDYLYGCVPDTTLARVGAKVRVVRTRAVGPRRRQECSSMSGKSMGVPSSGDEGGGRDDI